MAAGFRFDSKQPEAWPAFLRRVKNHVASKGDINDGQKKGILLDALDDAALDRLERWLEPVSVDTSTYQHILEALTVNMAVPVNHTAQYIRFTARRQEPGESVQALAEALSVLVATLGIEDRAARDKLTMYQFTAGLQDQALQDRILDIERCTLTQAIDTACQHEATRRSAAVLRAEQAGVYKVSGPSGPSVSSGAGIMCYYCAGPHKASSCTVDREKLFCGSCRKKGHVSAVCKGARRKDKRGKDQVKPESTNLVADPPLQNDPFSWSGPTTGDFERDLCGGLYFLSDSDMQVPPPQRVQLQIQGKNTTMILDNGAGRAMVSMSFYEDLPGKPLLKPIPQMFTAWDPDMAINVAGYCAVEVNFKGRTHTLPLLVAHGKGPCLLGRNWFKALGFAVVEVEGVNAVIECSEIKEMVRTYSAVSSTTIGCYTGPPVRIYVDPAKAPRYHRARDVKLPLVTKMEEAITSNVKRGLWVPVDHSLWASAIVPVAKRDGTLRLCADYKSTVNPVIEDDPYKSPSTDAVLDALAGGKLFAEIDLQEAYSQIPVDEETSSLLAVNTVKGLHRVTRLPFGIKTAPAIFQRIMDGLLGGLAGVIVYQDNIYIKSESLEQHKVRLGQVLKILSEAGFTVNAEKCTWVTEDLQALGFRVSAAGVHPCENKVDAIQDAPPPQNMEQLQSWLGLISFYERFFQGKAHILEPLHRLLDGGRKWEWRPEHQSALEYVKKLISSDQVLVHYNLELPLSIICDASPWGVGAVLCHSFGTGACKEERPIRFASRTLSATERRYSQLDREALAIMFAVKKFSRYIYGRKFLLVTDHKPLTSIFDPQARVQENLSPRMTRWVLALGALDYRIQHRAGADIGHADCLSRLPVGHLSEDQHPEPAGILLLEAQLPDSLDAGALAKETAVDPLLSQVLAWVQNGWPDDVPAEAEPFHRKRNSLSIQNGCLLYTDRVVIPSSRRSQVLKLIHAAHPGIACSKEIARAIVWWPRLHVDIETEVRTCTPCQLAANHPKSKPYSPWPAAERPWQRVHLDYAGPYLGHNFLIAVDAFSKWPVIKVMPGMSASQLITTLRYIFADCGCPAEIVTDNGRSFIAASTADFLAKNGVKLLHSPPWHPASNGLAERTVQTFKRTMERFSGDVHTRLARTLWAMRSKPSSVTGKSPAEIFLHRGFDHQLSRLHPRSLQHPTTAPPPNPFKKGMSVWFSKHKSKDVSSWVPGEVAATHGGRTCDVLLEDGEIASNAHVDFVRPRWLETVREEAARTAASNPIAPTSVAATARDANGPFTAAASSSFPPLSEQHAPPVDEVSNGATKDGATSNGATKDGATKDGATKDGATKDGATKDGATKDGATKDGATKDGATKDGATKDGATKDTTDGATRDGANEDGGARGGATMDNGTEGAGWSLFKDFDCGVHDCELCSTHRSTPSPGSSGEGWDIPENEVNILRRARQSQETSPTSTNSNPGSRPLSRRSIGRGKTPESLELQRTRSGRPVKAVSRFSPPEF